MNPSSSRSSCPLSSSFLCIISSTSPGRAWKTSASIPIFSTTRGHCYVDLGQLDQGRELRAPLPPARSRPLARLRSPGARLPAGGRPPADQGVHHLPGSGSRIRQSSGPQWAGIAWNMGLAAPHHQEARWMACGCPGAAAGVSLWAAALDAIIAVEYVRLTLFVLLNTPVGIGLDHPQIHPAYAIG